MPQQGSVSNASAVRPPTVVYLPGLSKSPSNSAERLATLIAHNLTQGPGTFTTQKAPDPGAPLTEGRRILDENKTPMLDISMLDYRAHLRLRCACRKPHPCWSAPTRDDVGAVPSWQAVLRQDDRPCCCDWPTSASPTPSPWFACSQGAPGTKTSRSSRCATRSEYCNGNSRHQSAIQPGRQGPTRRAPTPAITPDRAQAPSAGTPGHDPALAP
ncbi:hypothetical protein SAMN05661093_11059 [Kibdelosporangium aridum]|uniref:Uncharacterized protein n=1 Tax=Kibdelosporangium aridum TaxID=2030 RepID=A0A1Y5YDQ9_KIBAR|nr:hypothetical protein SAMN05661093_11059 [Kibdelosporangium aridum]